MPHLKVRGMDKKCFNWKQQGDNWWSLLKIIKCDRTWFTIEHMDTEYIYDGKIVDGYTFVELYWFERTPEVKAYGWWIFNKSY